ncbi:hypothetical protein VPH35_088653 [Triticum aestivum]
MPGTETPPRSPPDPAGFGRPRRCPAALEARRSLKVRCCRRASLPIRSGGGQRPRRSGLVDPPLQAQRQPAPRPISSAGLARPPPQLPSPAAWAAAPGPAGPPPPHRASPAGLPLPPTGPQPRGEPTPSAPSFFFLSCCGPASFSPYHFFSSPTNLALSEELQICRNPLALHAYNNS